MSLLKKLKKSDNPSQHPQPLNTSPQIGAGLSSIGAGPGGASRSGNLETVRLDLIIAIGVNIGTISGGNRGADGELRVANSALGCADIQSQADAAGGQYNEESPLPRTKQRGQRRSPIHSSPSWPPFPPFTFIAKFVSNIPFGIIFYQQICRKPLRLPTRLKTPSHASSH